MRNLRECGVKCGVDEHTKIHHLTSKGRHLLFKNLLSGNEDVLAILGYLSWCR